jgi:hypothetical protein
MSLGQATASPTTCTMGANPGATCTSLAVTCSGETDTAEIAVSEPAAGATVKGTITLHEGGAGTGYWAGFGAMSFIPQFIAANYRVVQIKWGKSWQLPTLGAKRSGCFPATAYDWIYRNVHHSDTMAGFCGAGISGGGASLGYSLTTYGLKNLFDYVMVVSGPAVSRMDVGCDVASFTGPMPELCPSIPSPVYPLPSQVINGIEQTTTCGCTTPSCVSSADRDRWRADSIVSDGADFDYPKTAMSFWFCGNDDTNGSTGGAFYYDAVKNVSTNSVTVNCFGGPSGPTSTCEGEGVFKDPAAFNGAISAMTTGCIPRH